MLATYRALLRVPGGPAFSAASFLLRLPIAMYGLGSALLVLAGGRSYAVAGSIAATVSLLQATCGPVVGRLIDRQGQARVMVPAVVLHGLGLAALLAAVLAHAPTWTLYPGAAVYGAAYPPAGSMVRARWAHVLAGTPLLATAYSVESILDEVIFIVGPVLVTVLATGPHPPAGLLVAYGCALAGTIALAPQRRTEPPPSPADEPRHPSAMRVAGLRVLVAVAAALGGLFGALELVTVAFCTERGSRPAAGLVLALVAVGSMVSGLAYGAVPWQAPLRRRLLIGLGCLALAVGGLPLAGTVTQLALLGVLAGATFAPTLIALFGLVEELVPAATRTEGLTWLTGGFEVGVAVTASLVGRVIDLTGARPAFGVLIGCGVVAAVVAVTGAGRLVAGPDGRRGDEDASYPDARIAE